MINQLLPNFVKKETKKIGTRTWVCIRVVVVCERVPYAVGFWIGVVTVGHGFHERKTAISKVRLLRDVARRWLACVARS